jgi:hypothetical protein
MIGFLYSKTEQKSCREPFYELQKTTNTKQKVFN